jgi:phosphohistidine phosphatase
VKIYIMRHGPAEETSITGRDEGRVLTTSGRDRVRDVARALVSEGEAPRVILTSPLARAKETAEIVAEVCQLDANVDVETTRDIAPGGDGVALVSRLIAEKRKRVMLVGHEPDLSGLVFNLTGRGLEMRKAMVVGVSAREDGTRLRFVLDPKSLAFERAD